MNNKVLQMPLQSRFKEDSVIEIGIDEAGRGSFWGPIMAGAVILPLIWTAEHHALFSQLRDSKKISAKKRSNLALQLKEMTGVHTAVGIISSDEINMNGIQWANQEAFRRAAQSIAEIPSMNVRLLIDGTLSIAEWKDVEQELIIEGDDKYIAIAAASILAKVAHDEWIMEYCVENPECNERYDLVKSKGYGTARHRDGIKHYGGHALHRDLYIQNWLHDGSHVSKKTAKKDEFLFRF